MKIARSLLLWSSQNRWLESQMRRRTFARRAVRRFLPGEDVEAALEAATALAARDIGSVLTQLGENVTERTEADGVRTHYFRVLEEIRRRGLPSVISVKPTQLGLDLDATACADATTALVARAAPATVWIDMEDSRYVDRTLELFRTVRAQHDNVGVCLQAYLRRTPADLETLAPLNPAIRLVKGAYAEPASVAFPAKRDVDSAYLALGEQLIAHAARNGAPPPVLGTHDVRLAAELQRRAAAAGLPKQACEIHMLYGVRSADQARLAREGYGVRVLISYGTAWFRWYMRRLAERPANVWFVLRSVVAG